METEKLTPEQIARALKDADYRASLTAAQRAQLPADPLGPVELTDGEVDQGNRGLLLNTRSRC